MKLKVKNCHYWYEGTSLVHDDMGGSAASYREARRKLAAMMRRNPQLAVGQVYVRCDPHPEFVCRTSRRTGKVRCATRKKYSAAYQRVVGKPVEVQ
jgi:hypothetical protein